MELIVAGHVSPHLRFTLLSADFYANLEKMHEWLPFPFSYLRAYNHDDTVSIQIFKRQL